MHPVTTSPDLWTSPSREADGRERRDVPSGSKDHDGSCWKNLAKRIPEREYLSCIRKRRASIEAMIDDLLLIRKVRMQWCLDVDNSPPATTARVSIGAPAAPQRSAPSRPAATDAAAARCEHHAPRTAPPSLSQTGSPIWGSGGAIDIGAALPCYLTPGDCGE